MSLESAGSLIEVLGAAITGLGLVIAWHKAAHRLPRYRRVFGAAAKLVRLGRGQTKTIGGQTTGVASLTAGGTTKISLDQSKPIGEQVETQLNRLWKEIANVEDSIQGVKNLPKVTTADIDEEVANALDKFKTDLEIHAVKDLWVALFGIVVTIAGIVVGMCA